jgi:hypothetical protein
MKEIYEENLTKGMIIRIVNIETKEDFIAEILDNRNIRILDSNNERTYSPYHAHISIFKGDKFYVLNNLEISAYLL